ncbi:MAG: flagella basal body P-ring formation protein FlgA [Alphaproteobacteria bacterium CG11_big_fil_rev_8_21_14_0_20_44_7]|nr:MAG: flagella basal body P-ring formation protein FlgA [Alphaproteobacteria bacterium CG11_big_fil_rev_8_21_14_0_20_44_7]
MRKYLFIIALIFANLATQNAQANSVTMAESLVKTAIIDNSHEFVIDSDLEAKIIKGKDFLSKQNADDMKITQIEIDTDQRNFTAYLSINDNLPQEIGGKYYEMVEVPAVNHKMRKGEIITASDIESIRIESYKLDRGYITDENEIIGKTPSRNLYNARPLMPNQISEPLVVNKKDNVTMVFNNNMLSMQDLGVALEEGVEGDLIRIKNATSGIIVHARIIGKNLVEVEGKNKILASK